MVEETKSFRRLIEEQKKTTIAIEKSMMDAEQRAEFEAREREKFEKRSEAAQRGAETRRENLLKQQNPNSAANKEKQDEQNTYLKDTFGKFLGKNSAFAKSLTGIGQSLKQKVQGGIAGIFTALKAGAFLLFLGGMVKFLQSPTFKELQDKYLPVIADGLQSLYDTLKFIAEGFFVTDPDTGKTTFSAAAGLSNIMSMITSSFLGWITSLKDAFYDENGDFTLTGGIKNLAGDFATILASIVTFGGLLAPQLFFGTLWQIGKGGSGLAITALSKIATSFGSLFTSIGGFNTSLSETGTAMDSKVKTSKSKGIFGKAGKSKFGILARFGRLFGKIGLFGGAIALLGAGMSGLLNTEKASGVFSDTAKGISNAFKGLFNVLSDFGSSIAKVATKAAAKASSIVTKALDDIAKIGAKIKPTKIPTGVDPALKKAAEQQKLLKSKALSGGGRGSIVEEAGERAKYLSQFDKAATKTTAEIVERSVLRSIAKKVPLFSLVAGTGFAIDRLSKGEYGKAFLEFASGVAGVFAGPGTAGSVAIDAGLLASDLGISVEEAKKLILASGGEVAKAEVKPSGTAKPMNLANIKTYGDYLKVKDKMTINPAYDTDGDGVYNRLEFRNAMQGQRNLNTPMTAGPAFISAPTVNNNQNNIQSSPIVPLDPLMREAISAM